MKCDREACILRLERLAASASIMAKEMKFKPWHNDMLIESERLANDANIIKKMISEDTSWAAADR